MRHTKQLLTVLWKKSTIKILLLSMAVLFICSCEETDTDLYSKKDIGDEFKQFISQCDCNYEVPPPPPDHSKLRSGEGDTTSEAIDQAIASCNTFSQSNPSPSSEDCQLFEKTNQKQFESTCECKNSESVQADRNTADEAITDALEQAKTNPNCSQITKSDCIVKLNVYYKAIKK